MKKNPNAFPLVSSIDNQPGMSLRDYFAAHALTGILANANPLRLSRGEEDLTTGDCFARRAYLFADAMLAERAK